MGVGTDVIDGQWWRLLTYLLPQKLGLPHLLLNATGIGFYGPFLERRIGHAAMLATYAVSGVFGGAWLVGAGQREPNAGASLALFGVLAALASVDLILSRADALPDAAFRRSLVIVVAVTVLLWPIEAAALIYEGRHLTLGLSFWGIVRHSPGLVAGLVLGFAFGISKVRRSAAWASVAVAGVLFASAAFVEFRTGLWPLWP
jgi:membrane associated rhomboid family serine protease